MRRHAFSKRARFLDMIRRPSWSSLVRTIASTSSPRWTSSRRVDGLADRQLVGRDDALGLVADVDEHLVLVDAHDVPGDDLALLDLAEGRVVVRDDLAVDLEQQPVRAVDDPRLRVVHHSLHRPKRSAALSLPGPMPVQSHEARMRSARPCSGTATCWSAGRASRGSPSPRELAGSGARVLVLDRYEIGERQTSACGDPDRVAARDGSGRLRAPELRRARRPHAAGGPRRWQLPWSFSTFDYRELCALLWARAGDAEFETATVTGSARATPSHTDRGELRAPLIVDALGWRRVLSERDPDPAAGRAALARPGGAPAGRGRDMELWIDTKLRARGLLLELPGRRRAARRRRLVLARATTSRSRRCASPATSACRRSGYQGNWIPHQLRRAAEDGVFFAGDSAGHCLPLTAEGIRTALYFGLACGRELRAVIDGPALARAGAAGLRRLLGLARAQVPLAAERAARDRPDHARAARSRTSCARSSRRRLTRWAFDQYLAIAPPSYVAAGAGPSRASRPAGRAIASPVAGVRA